MLEEQQPSMDNQPDVAEEDETDIVESDEGTVVDEDTVVSDEAAKSEEESEAPPSIENEINQLKSEYEVKLD